MSTTKTTLFALAKMADSITVAGYTAESQCIEAYFGPDRPRTLRLTCSDDVDYHFADQEVELLEDGQALAYDCCEDEDEAPTLYRLRFTVERPLTAADLLPAGQ